MIRFLIKSVFWLGLAFIVMPRLLPTDAAKTPAPVQSSAPAKAEPDAVDKLLANGRTAVEIGKLCVDNPEFCKQGTSFISGAASELLQGSGTMLDYLSARFGGKQQVAEEPAAKEEPAQSAIPVPTSRESALRALDHAATGAIPAQR